MKNARLLVRVPLWSLILAVPSAQALAADGWGASYTFNAVQPSATNHVTYARTTMVPGRAPISYWSSSSIGPLYLWPGLSNSTSDLV